MYNVVLFSMVLSIAGQLCIPQNVKVDSVETITIFYTDFYNETFADVGCNDFMREFVGDIKELKVTEKHIMKKITSMVKGMKPDTSNVPIDARAKIIIKYNSMHIDMICVDMFTIYLNGQHVRDNADFINMIRTYIKRHIK